MRSWKTLWLLSWLVLTATDSAATPIGRILEECRRLQSAERWAACDSLALLVLPRIETETPGDTVSYATALYLIAAARYSQRVTDSLCVQSAEKSLRLRERALPPDDLDLASSHHILGCILSANKQPDRALSHLRSALAIRQSRLAPLDTLIVDTRIELARVYVKNDFPDSALTILKGVEQDLEDPAGPPHPGLAAVLDLKGDVERRLGEYEKARSDLERSIRIYEETLGENCRQMESPVANLARLETQSGNLARSVDLFHLVVDLSLLHAGPNDVRTAQQRNELGDRLLQLGDADGAREQLGLALPVITNSYGSTDHRTINLQTKLALACLESGDTLEAVRRLEAVRPALEKVAPGRPDYLMLQYCLQAQANLLLVHGEPRRALELVRHGWQIETSRSKPDDIARTVLLRQLARVAVALGDPKLLGEAESELSLLLDQLKGGSLTEQCELLVHRARVRDRLGLRAQARQDALAGDSLSLNAALCNVYALSDRQALLFTDVLSSSLDEVVELATVDSDNIRTALEHIVLWRGAIRAALAARRPPANAPADTALAGAHARWMSAQARYARAVVAGGDRRNPGAADGIRALRSAAEDAEGRYVFAAGGRAPVSIYSESLLDSIQSRLEDGQALASLVEVHPRTDSARVVVFLFRGRGETVTRLDLGASKRLEPVIARWMELAGRSPTTFSSGVEEGEKECRRVGNELRRLAWDPVHARLPDVEDLYLVPAGPLLGLPWHALPDSGEGYLVEHAPRIHVLNAERELLERTERKAGAGSLLVAGGIDYDDLPGGESGGSGAPSLLDSSLRSLLEDCNPPRPLAFAPLPGTLAEARAIAGAWARAGGRSSVMLLTGDAATEAAFKQTAPGRSVLHLATHGVVWGNGCAAADEGSRGVGGVSPLSGSSPAEPAKATAPRMGDRLAGRRVWLALAGANRARSKKDENEGLLTAEEIVLLDLRAAQWVVLSACNSGMGEGWSREGLAGMRRAFHLAGARTVIASQWAVEDASTREWMQALYEARISGVPSVAHAIQEASLKILEARRKSGRSTHPFYWGGFLATGE